MLLVLLATILAGCSALSRTRDFRETERSVPGTVLLISLDGFRWDYIERFAPPNLTALAETGVRAKALIPVFPTKTFPNHYSIVTGLYPAEHGIISNNMYDPDRDAWFSMRDREAVSDPAWWGGEPIWVTAEKQGLITATYFWPGSEGPIDGIQPTYWKEFDDQIPGHDRVAEVLGWLDLPEEQRPAFVSMYFSDVDNAGHEFGPDDPRTGEVIARVDGYLGALLEGLQERNLLESTNILVVSDHGIASRSPDRVVFLDDYLESEDANVVDGSPVLALWPKALDVDSLYARLHGVHDHLQIYRRQEIPERFRFSNNPRIAPIIGIADEGWSIGRRSRFQSRWYSGGTHGYDNELSSMHGILIAYGPEFGSFGLQVELPAINSIHLYELMADIIGVTPAPNSGSAEATAHMRSPTRDKRVTPSTWTN
jgi:predicted AlkP superfamily pyrophosphatase or phosphodiesterase